MNSLWLDSNNNNNKFDNLNDDINCDVCIIGGGIFGLTCAYYLSKVGLDIVVLEKDSIGGKATGHTTGKITSQHGLFYKYLVDNFGIEYAKDYLFSNEQAIQNIKEIIDNEQINCDFEYQSNFVYTMNKSELNIIKEEVDYVNKLGYQSNFVTSTALPFDIQGAIQFKNQVCFNSIKYINGLVDCIIKNNGKIFENTLVTDLKNNDNFHTTFTANNNTITSKYVIFACNFPFLNFPGMYFLKMYQSTSYIIAIDPKKTPFNGMYITASSPTLSLRHAYYNGKKIILIGGGDHKTGITGSYEKTYGYLEEFAKQYYPNCEILFKWDTEDSISIDKIPYIGPFSTTMSGVYIGTGFKKWGMTLSNVAANIIYDMVLGNANQYSYLYDSTRYNPIKNRSEVKNVLNQSINSLFINKLKHSKTSFDSIKDNSGGIVDINNQKVGIFKDTSGNIFAINPICPHLGCLLSWNDTDKTWDCPCHGSRFDFMGKNIYGPAYSDLEIYNV